MRFCTNIYESIDPQTPKNQKVYNVVQRPHVVEKLVKQLHKKLDRDTFKMHFSIIETKFFPDLFF